MLNNLLNVKLIMMTDFYHTNNLNCNILIQCKVIYKFIF